MRKFGWMTAVAVSAVVAVAGCSTLGRAAFENPVVNLRGVTLRGVGLTGGTLDVALAVYNPNNYRLDATQMTYKLSMAGDSITVADGVVTDRFTVQDRDTARVTIPVNFTYAGLGAVGRTLLNTGVVNYRVTGVVSVGSPVGSVNVPYSSTGRFTTTGMAR
jgi:LEA14-like dessication related protein